MRLTEGRKVCRDESLCHQVNLPKHENFANNDICINDLDDGLDGPVTITILITKSREATRKRLVAIMRICLLLRHRQIR